MNKEIRPYDNGVGHKSVKGETLKKLEVAESGNIILLQQCVDLLRSHAWLTRTQREEMEQFVLGLKDQGTEMGGESALMKLRIMMRRPCK